MMNRVSALAILLSIFSISRVESQENIFSEYDSKEPVTRVSLVQLKSTPEKYDGKKVAVQGVFSHWFEDTSIYFSKEDYDYHNVSNEIMIDLYTQRGALITNMQVELINMYGA